jgi:signal transduction histidine kinase
MSDRLEPDSQIVIGPDGTVLAVAGHVPPDLADVRLDDCASLPGEIREAAKALALRLRDSETRVVTQTVALQGAGPSVLLVAIEALVIRRRATDVRALLTSKLAVISFQAAAADVMLRIEVADDVPALVHLDSEKVAWAVTTLVGNALRYVRAGSRRMPGGTIGVQTKYDPATSEVTIEVNDDGPGIPADTVSRLFKRDGLNVQGAGLALPLISDIMAAHGGRVGVRSKTDSFSHGTTIRLTFPNR